MPRPWAYSGLLFFALFLCGIAASGNFPAAGAPTVELREYATGNRAHIHTLSLFHALAAVALVAYGAYVHASIRRLGGGRDLAALALGGATFAAGFLLASALLFWTLALPAVAEDASLLRALHHLAVLAGGDAFVLPLGTLVGAVSLGGAELPPWLTRSGRAAAALAIASPATMLGESGVFSPGGGAMILIAGVTMLWLFALTILLIRRSRENTQTELALQP